ncbi:AlpA family transcriptional regulator [Roseibium sp. MMSF_3412]|uniref:helix-turn-helix transcriptional regulator n=1 Tax=Roseibium sp. MMSF_3412 TaxID=3046712 RepID=UPI00273E81E1|nr:AlpA family phage regulatory protein [Roseibium sp. MMSF_3412]
MDNTKANNPAKLLFLRRDDLKALGIWQSNSTLLRLEAAGKFPRRVRLASASVCWDRAEIMAWIDARKAERANWHYADPF